MDGPVCSAEMSNKSKIVMMTPAPETHGILNAKEMLWEEMALHEH